MISKQEIVFYTVIAIVVIIIGYFMFNTPTKIEYNPEPSSTPTAEVDRQAEYLKLLEEGCFKDEVPVPCKG